MKSLVFGIVLILVIGIGGFVYRNVQERTGGPAQIACTQEAKICPDGSSVGRSGPACEFPACPFPNVEIIDTHLSFVVPKGYSADEHAYGAEPTLVAAFVKPSLTDTVLHTLTIRQYPLGEGEMVDDVILAHTRYQPADTQAENFSRFETLFINGTQFRMTVIERFEGIVHSAYFLTRATDILMVEIVEHDVTSWMDTDLNVRDLPEHHALERELLGSLQTTP